MQLIQPPEWGVSRWRWGHREKGGMPALLKSLPVGFNPAPRRERRGLSRARRILAENGQHFAGSRLPTQGLVNGEKRCCQEPCV